MGKIKDPQESLSIRTRSTESRSGCEDLTKRVDRVVPRFKKDFSLNRTEEPCLDEKAKFSSLYSVKNDINKGDIDSASRIIDEDIFPLLEDYLTLSPIMPEKYDEIFTLVAKILRIRPDEVKTIFSLTLGLIKYKAFPCKSDDFFIKDGADTAASDGLSGTQTPKTPQLGPEAQPRASEKGCDVSEPYSEDFSLDAQEGQGDLPLCASSTLCERYTVMAQRTTGDKGVVPLTRYEPAETEEEKQQAVNRFKSLNDMSYSLIPQYKCSRMSFDEERIMVNKSTFAFFGTVILTPEDGSPDLLVFRTEKSYPRAATARRKAKYEALKLMFPCEMLYYSKLRRNDAADPDAAPAEAVETTQPIVEKMLASIEQELPQPGACLTYQLEGEYADQKDRIPSSYYCTVYHGKKDLCREKGPTVVSAIKAATDTIVAAHGLTCRPVLDELWENLCSAPQPALNVTREYVQLLCDLFFGKGSCIFNSQPAKHNSNGWESEGCISGKCPRMSPQSDSVCVSYAIGASKKDAVQLASEQMGRYCFPEYFERLFINGNDVQRTQAEAVLRPTVVLGVEDAKEMKANEAVELLKEFVACAADELGFDAAVTRRRLPDTNAWSVEVSLLLDGKPEKTFHATSNEALAAVYDAGGQCKAHVGAVLASRWGTGAPRAAGGETATDAEAFAKFQTWLTAHFPGCGLLMHSYTTVRLKTDGKVHCTISVRCSKDADPIVVSSVGTGEDSSRRQAQNSIQNKLKACFPTKWVQ